VGYRAGRGVGPRGEPELGLGVPLVVGLVLALLVGVAWFTGALEYGYWWATNASPPTISLAGPSDAVRGATAITVRVEPADRAGIVEASLDSRPLAPSESLAVDTTGLPDGDHLVVVVAEDRSWRRNRSSATAVVRSDNTAPRLSLEAQPERVPQGHTWLLRIRSDEPAAIQACLGGRPLEIQAASGFGWALVGFGPEAQPTAIPLLVDGTDRLGNRGEQQLSVQVVPHEFPRDQVQVSPNLQELLAGEVRVEEDARLAANYQKVSQPRLWEGRFIVPVQGPIITEFGERRSYNGGPEVGHHGGTDFAAPAGRPVVAANRGRVALIDEVRLRGRVLILDHGLGVFTTYAHLESVDVQFGQVVEKGQTIARVGNTGLSTGPHLHWELWTNGANVDPMEWTQRDLP
jgi:murein DD-endopeptidase MepM/ murein hydrolase activator NlpD